MGKKQLIVLILLLGFFTLLLAEKLSAYHIARLSNIDEYAETPQTQSISQVLGLATSSKVINHGDRSKKQIALTFDADMTPGMQELLRSGKVASFYDEKLIDTLVTTNTKATLFLTGMWMQQYSKETQEFAQNPLFELANHSYSHKGFTRNCYDLDPLPDDKDREEIGKPQIIMQNITGKKAKYFRFPGGCYDIHDLEILLEENLTPIGWDVAGWDGFNGNRAQIEQHILSTVQNGSIIVMHMNGDPNEPETANAVADIIPTLRNQGYEFVTISEILPQ